MKTHIKNFGQKSRSQILQNKFNFFFFFDEIGYYTLLSHCINNLKVIRDDRTEKKGRRFFQEFFFIEYLLNLGRPRAPHRAP